ncbi:MAG: DNA adenine methylase [Verrucomicrobiaceae bacterium]|nr:DNA adenine methylase [Verrucomicrobiaceae bacterium]
MRSCTRPALRYAGGKFRIAAEIVAMMPAHDVYVEPFAGAASVLLAKAPAACEVYNDLCDDVVNLFRQLRDAPEALIRSVYLTPYARGEYERAYEHTSDDLERARRLVYRSMAGMGADASRRASSFRTTLVDGRYAHAKSWAGMPDGLAMVAERLRSGVIIEKMPALEVMRRFDSERALHFVDPPYLGGTRKQRARAYNHEMADEASHEELIKFLGGLAGQWMLCGYESKLYARLLKGWPMRKLKQRDQRNAQREECVWMNFEPEAMLL